MGVEGATKEVKRRAQETEKEEKKNIDREAKKTMRRKLAANNKGESRGEGKNCCEKRGNGKGHDNEPKKKIIIKRKIERKPIRKMLVVMMVSTPWKNKNKKKQRKYLEVSQNQ